ncbi:37S ribosomal protein S18, mitochondrial [Erysiphe neolycopersici]|uniref:37S ribosomal protein S18, mitochondrial n=1 Tax=Erysiphe neolycopersici TaxID=212602 RepID=A0A420HG31_9PEZI|nr:37S ribosomal protein S18, mitochondrial [Erysiphe neolycopersici]
MKLYRLFANRVFLKDYTRNLYSHHPWVFGLSHVVTFQCSAFSSVRNNQTGLDSLLDIANKSSGPDTMKTDENDDKKIIVGGRKPPVLDSTKISSDGTMSLNENLQLSQDGIFKDVTWQMHIYAHRHNVHITIARPPAWRHPVTGKVYGDNPPSRSVALSLCAGRLGFKHSGRKHYDSAFQLGTYVMARMQESGMNSYIEKLEVYLRGFGAGREAVTRVLLGVEGKHLRGKIIKVADSTRLKIGGTRSPNPRRLG